MTTPDDRPYSETTADDRRTPQSAEEPHDRGPDDSVTGDRETDDPGHRDPTQLGDREAGVAGTTETSAGPATEAATRDQDLSAEPLVPRDAAVDFNARWEVIQQGFVDDPRNAVTEADKLVDDVLKRLSAGFDQQHQELEEQWSAGEPSTEDLRSALQRYRAFFHRLLAL